MVLIGFLISLYIAYGAHRRGSLTQTGALWAVVVGTLVFGLGDGIAGLALVAFFLSSTALGKFRRGEKAEASESAVSYTHLDVYKRQILAFVRGKMPVYVEGRPSFGDVREMAAAHVAALTKGRSGDTYILGGNNVTLTELLAAIQDLSLIHI